MAIDYKPEQNDYTNLTPFKTWLVNQINSWGVNNFPFLEGDFDKLTNYGMLMKMMKCLNDIINNENLVEDDMAKMYQAFTELQTYINNYFDNLDVQEEINNKLDDMTADGTLTQIIKNYVDPIQEDFENEINEIVEIQNQSITNISNRVSQVASGSPLVASSTSGMTDTTRIYVNTTDGKWYYYNGSGWVIGGTYQSTEIADGSIIPEKTNFLVQDDENLFKVMTKTENGFSSSFDYDTQVTSFTGSTPSSQRQLIMTKYLTAGSYAFHDFNNSGTKPPIYIYTQANYESQNWNDNIGFFASGNYGVNITVPEDGTYYFVVYLQMNSVFNYQGKIVFKKTSSYTDLTSYIPVTYNFKDFINQTMTQATNKLNNFINIDYWNNKKCLLYGDSLTAWGSWGGYLASQFGLNVTNKGIANSIACYDPTDVGGDDANSGSSSLRLATLPSNNDLIVIMFGTNDYLRNHPLGTVPNTFNSSDTYDNTKFAGALLKILNYLYTNNPTARIILMCPIWNHYQTNQIGTLRTYGDIIKEVGRLTGTPVVDLFGNLNTNAINYTNYYNDAGTHLNDAGYMRIASILKEEIEALTPIYTE